MNDVLPTRDPASTQNQNEKTIDRPECWPALPFASWQETCATLHMWAQIIGKVRLGQTPLVNHWWNVPLYVDARGLTTSSMPHGAASFEIRFDFIEHELILEKSDGVISKLRLAPMTVAEFYRGCMALLQSAGLAVKIWRMPVEIPSPIAFEQDTTHHSYDRDAVEKFWRILMSVEHVLQEFRGEFIGKSSPVHFFWGSFDLAVTRFSGRRAPERPGADAITREAYSHEVSSVGFWPGSTSGSVQDAAFYSYAAPQPAGFEKAQVRPAAARYDMQLSEFVLMYEDVRTAKSPSAALLEFCRTTYAAAAELGKWERGELERMSARTPKQKS